MPIRNPSRPGLELMCGIPQEGCGSFLAGLAREFADLLPVFALLV